MRSNLPCNPQIEEAPNNICFEIKTETRNAQGQWLEVTDETPSRILLHHLDGGVLIAKHRTAHVDCPNRLPFVDVCWMLDVEENA